MYSSTKSFESCTLSIGVAYKESQSEWQHSVIVVVMTTLDYQTNLEVHTSSGNTIESQIGISMILKTLT